MEEKHILKIADELNITAKQVGAGMSCLILNEFEIPLYVV